MSTCTKVFFQSKGVTNVKNLYELILCHTHEDAKINNPKTKNNWTNKEFNSVDWNSHEITFNILIYCEKT